MVRAIDMPVVLPRLPLLSSSFGGRLLTIAGRAFEVESAIIHTCHTMSTHLAPVPFLQIGCYGMDLRIDRRNWNLVKWRCVSGLLLMVRFA